MTGDQSNFASFLAFLKRLPNLKKLDIGFFFFSASQMPHSIESMSTRQLARNFPSLFSLLHCLIDTSLREIYLHALHHVSGAACWRRDDLAAPFERQAWS